MNLEITTNKKILIITIFIALFTFIGTKKFIYDPGTQRFKNKLKSLDEEYEKNRIFFEIKKVSDEISAYSSEILKSEKDLPWLLGKISEIFNILQLEISAMEPQPLEKTEFYTLIPVRVKTICSYHSLGELVSKLESLEKFVEISHIELKSLSVKSQDKKETTGPGDKIKQAKFDKSDFVLAELTLKVSAVFLNK